jgi:hypothetical protein
MALFGRIRKHLKRDEEKMRRRKDERKGEKQWKKIISKR